MTKNILIVEDEGLIADDIRRRLERLGYAVPAIASSGDEALHLAHSVPCDLALMDIRLKGDMDGIAVARKLRDEFQIPVVYLTAHADADTVDRATPTEPFGYILKPIANASLRTTIQIALYKHEMERRLRVSEAWLSTTIRSIGDAIIATDPDGLVIFMNDAAARFTGTSAVKCVGRPLLDVLDLRTGSGDPASNPIHDLLPDETRAYALHSHEGRRTLVELACFENRDNMELLGAIVIFRDIRERSEWESHRIQFHRMDAINSVAAFPCLNPPSDSSPEIIDVNQLIAVLAPGFEIETSLDPNTALLHAGRAQFQHVILSLLRRATVAASPGSASQAPAPTVSSSILDLNPGDLLARRSGRTWFARIEIAVSGAQLDTHSLTRIFEPFGHGNDGFDLSIAYNMVVQAGGRITASSEPGRGLVFELLWPCIGTYQGVLPVMRRFPEPAPGILIAEEEDALRRSVCTCLEREGYRFIETKTVEHAAAIAASRLHLIDALVLPERAAPLPPALNFPTLFLSGYRHDRALSSDTLAKPFPMLEFQRRIRRLVPDAWAALREMR